MTQRKKKPSAHQQQKVASAQHRNEFFRSFKHVINGINGEDVYSLIPKNVLENLYELRSHKLRVVVPKGNKVPHEIFDDAKCILSAWAKREKIVIAPNGFEISLDEYYSIALTVMNFYNGLTTDKWPYIAHVKAGLEDFIDDSESLFNQANTRLFGILQAFGIGICDMSKTLYWYKHEIVSSPDLGKGIHNVVNLFSHEVESAVFTIDGHSRPVKRVGWAIAYKGIEWVDLKPSLIAVNSINAETPMKVYIQSHALLRLAERLDCFTTGLLHLNLYHSLKDAKVFYDNHGNVLIEYRFFDTKAGYLRLDIVNGAIVIRTFLFVTNNGTPEGQLLEKNTGLQLLDKKYLAIDKLSTFMSSDIGNNQEVRKIFEGAGCHCLLELYEKVSVLSTKHPEQSISKLLLDYLERKNALA